MQVNKALLLLRLFTVWDCSGLDFWLTAEVEIEEVYAAVDDAGQHLVCHIAVDWEIQPGELCESAETERSRHLKLWQTVSQAEWVQVRHRCNDVIYVLGMQCAACQQW